MAAHLGTGKRRGGGHVDGAPGAAWHYAEDDGVGGANITRSNSRRLRTSRLRRLHQYGGDDDDDESSEVDDMLLALHVLVGSVCLLSVRVYPSNNAMQGKVCAAER